MGLTFITGRYFEYIMIIYNAYDDTYSVTFVWVLPIINRLNPTRLSFISYKTQSVKCTFNANVRLDNDLKMKFAVLFDCTEVMIAVKCSWTRHDIEKLSAFLYFVRWKHGSAGQ